MTFPENEHLLDLQKILKRHPDLQGKYDALLAECLLLKEKSKEAEAYALRMFKRIAPPSIHHAAFARITLMISKGEWQKALKESYMLKEKMEKDTQFWSEQSSLIRFGSPLYAYTLLRIAMLEQAAGATSNELKAWEDLESCLRPSVHKVNIPSYHPEDAALFEQAFRLQDVSLSDYIQYRKSLLLKLG
jgi:hypothetical protein